MLDRITPPNISAFPHLSLPEFKVKTLNNGVTLQILDSGDEAVSRLSIHWHAGLIDVKSPAACNLMASLLSEGCEGLSGKEVTDILESNGAWLKISPTQHSTVLTLHSINHTAKEIIPLIGRIISSPSFPAESLDSLKKKAAADKELASLKPSYQAAIITRQTLYGENHPLAKVITPDEILAVTRENIVELHQSIILSNKPTAFLSGKITPEIEALVCEMLSAIPFDESSKTRITRNVVPPQPYNQREICRKEMPDSLQTGIRIQIPTISRKHPDYEPLRFAVTALGGYFGSRLMANIREDKGYTYGIGASLIPALEGANVVISCECDNRYTDDVIKEVWQEIDRLANEELDDNEMHTVRNLIVSSLAGILDSPFTISSFIEQLSSLGLSPETYSRQFSEAIAVSADKVMEVARKYLSETPAVTALAGGKPS